jgi:hypothetical protein
MFLTLFGGMPPHHRFLFSKTQNPKLKAQNPIVWMFLFRLILSHHIGSLLLFSLKKYPIRQN